MLTISDYLNLFAPCHREKPRFMALAEAVLSQAADLLSLVQTGFPEAWSLDTAVGSQLDALGNLLNVPWPSPETSDTDYRFLLRARVALNHWDGTNETAPAVMAQIFPGRNVKYKDQQNGTVMTTIPGAIPFSADLLCPLPAGIRNVYIGPIIPVVPESGDDDPPVHSDPVPDPEND